MLADVVPVEALLTIDSALIVALIFLARGLAKTREQLARLEEWQRLHNDRRDTDSGSGASRS